MTGERKVDKELAREIVSYCIRHPDAAGDLEDFARWRLLEQRVHQQVAETSKALEWLVNLGLLTRTPAGHSPIFKLNAEALREAERFVARPEDDPGEDPGTGEP